MKKKMLWFCKKKKKMLGFSNYLLYRSIKRVDENCNGV